MSITTIVTLTTAAADELLAATRHSTLTKGDECPEHRMNVVVGPGWSFSVLTVYLNGTALRIPGNPTLATRVVRELMIPKASVKCVCTTDDGSETELPGGDYLSANLPGTLVKIIAVQGAPSYVTISGPNLIRVHVAHIKLMRGSLVPATLAA